MPKPPFIVAEVSKNWPPGPGADPRLLCQLFEEVIATNLARGYLLHSWRYAQWDSGKYQPSQMIETIIAVFEYQFEPPDHA